MYSVLGSSQLKKENGLCEVFCFLPGKALSFQMRCDEYEREKTPHFKYTLQVFLKISCYL